MTTHGPEPDWLGRVDRWARSHGWAADALATLAVLAVLGGLSVGGAQGIRWSTGWVAALIACFAVLHLTVAVRSRAPEAAFLVAAAAMLVIVFAPDGRVTDHVPGGPTHMPALFLPSSLVFLLVLYSAASRLAAVRSRVALAIALVGVAIATRFLTTGVLGQFTAGGWLVGFYAGLGLATAVLVTWNLGRLAQVRRRRALTERAESARLAVLEERARIAREMHDIVAHSLAVIVRQAEGGAFVAERDPGRAGQTLRTIAGTGRGALADLRGLLGVLRDPASGVADAPPPTLADLPRLVAGVRDTGLDAELTQSGEAFPLSAATELAVCRLAQEGLTNAVKYAGPRARVAVELRWDPAELTVQVTDDGRGAAEPVPGAGAGLQGLRDRVGAVGGTFTAGRLEHGFRVRARFARLAAEARR